MNTENLNNSLFISIAGLIFIVISILCGAMMFLTLKPVWFFASIIFLILGKLCSELLK